MNRSMISQRISSILDDIQRLTNALYAMNTTDIQRYPDNYEVLSTDAALRAEKITCRLRHLIYASTTVKKAEYLASAVAVQGIRVGCEDVVFKVTLPGLLPKRKSWQSAEYLLDSLGAALSQYAGGHPLPRFQHCVIAFSHIYDRNLPERRIAAFVLTDDTGALCDTYHTTVFGSEDQTCISIMDRERFPAWLAAQKA